MLESSEGRRAAGKMPEDAAWTVQVDDKGCPARQCWTGAGEVDKDEERMTPDKPWSQPDVVCDCV